MLTRLVEEAEVDLADLFGDDGVIKPVKEWPTIWRQGLVSAEDRVIRRPDPPKGG